MRKIALAVLVGALTLSACGKKKEEAPATNNLVEPPVENVIIDEPEAPLPPANNAAAAPEPAPAPSISEQQQIQDDAEATGMTARLDNQPSEGGNSTN
jgi:hypothetical protein